MLLLPWKRSRICELFDQLKAVRAKGKKAKFHWLWNRARTKLKGEDTVIIRKHVITTCLSRYNVRMRARQRNKNKSKDAYRDDFIKWPSVTRERLIHTGVILIHMILSGNVFFHFKGSILTSHQCLSLSIQKRRTRLLKLEIVIDRYGLLSHY